MRSSSSTAQVYQRDPTERGGRPHSGPSQMPIKTGGPSRRALVMTDPRFQDLSELPRRMTATLDLHALSEDLTQRAIEATGAAIGAIALWDREHDRLVTLADIEVIEVGATVAPGETYALLEEYPASRRVLTERRAISIRVDRDEDDPAERDWLREHGLSAALLLPLVSRGEAIGQMYLARLEGSFDEDDLVYCQLLSDMAGSAIENAKLYGELQSTVTQYRSLIERLPAVTYLDDLETGETQYVSPQITGLFGITPDEWKSSPDAWLRAVHPDDRERARAAFTEATEAGKEFHAEYRVLSPDGAVRWVVDRTVILPRVAGQRALTQGMIFDITDRKRAEQELSHRASHDPLTGLPNRDQFRAALDEAIVSAQLHDGAVAVMYVDLDDFKLVNDGFGHEVGDELLAAVAQRLSRATRATDVVGRDGGDEFLVLLPNLPGGHEEATRAAEMAATRVRDALVAPVSAGAVEIHVSTSIGVSLFPFDAADTQTLLKHADAAMYDAKAAGRDARRFYEPGARDSEERLALAGRLRQAIKNSELALHYQPIVELGSGRMVGVEALARWIDSERGPIGPDEFIPLAERTGLIRPLTEWVIREASRQAAEWAAAGLDSRVSVNIPPDTCQQIGARVDRGDDQGRGLRSVAHHARDDRVRDDGAASRPRAGDGDPDRARHVPGHRRLRDRPLVARPPRRLPGRNAEDRPLVRERAAGGPGGAHAREGDHVPGPGVRPEGGGRGHRDRGPARLPPGGGLRIRPGLPVLTAGYGGRGRRPVDPRERGVLGGARRDRVLASRPAGRTCRAGGGRSWRPAAGRAARSGPRSGSRSCPRAGDRRRCGRRWSSPRPPRETGW